MHIDRKRAAELGRETEGVMKQHALELPLWCLIVVVSFLITAAWIIFVVKSEDRGYVVGMAGDGSPLFQDWTSYRHDGSFVGHSFNLYTQINSVYVIQPPTVSGLVAFWWPLAASAGVAFWAIIAALLPERGRLLRRRVQIPNVRITLFRVMVVIGVVAACLWLRQLDHYTKAAGMLVFGVVLYAGFRRSFLTRQSTAERAPATVLSRAGIAGYAVAVVLALLWVICTLVWEAYFVVRV
jgi:hypothetical protein